MISDHIRPPWPSRRQLVRDFAWNTSASLLASLSTVVMLATVTRSAGVAAGGVFSLALAIGQQMQTLGMFEVRSYHITDVKQVFTFPTYLAVRLITTAAMMIGIIFYSAARAGQSGTMLAVTLIALLRVFDSLEDVYYDELQRLGRLDLAGRAASLRSVATTLGFCLPVLVTGNLIVSALACSLTSTIGMVVGFFPACRGRIPWWPSWDTRAAMHLLRECFPLAISSFISIYLTNSPKYAIDRYLNDADQGVFAIIFMPAMAINLLSLFIYRPILTRIATFWASGDQRGFARGVLKGLCATALASLIVEFICIWAGPPILSFVFGRDVSGHLAELLILVAAGAFNAASIVLFYALTTMRLQRLVMFGYFVAAAAAVVILPALVANSGLLGAAEGYLLAMIILFVAFLLILIIIRKQQLRTSPRTCREPS